MEMVNSQVYDLHYFTLFPLDAGMSLQEEMPSRRLNSDALSFNGAVAAMENWKRSQSLLEQLPVRQLELDTFAYRAVVEKVTWEIALDLRDTWALKSLWN